MPNSDCNDAKAAFDRLMDEAKRSHEAELARAAWERA